MTTRIRGHQQAVARRHLRFRGLSTSALAVLGATAPARVPAQSMPAPAAVELRVPDRTNANPTAAASGTFVAVVWSAATVSAMDLFLAVSQDGGRSFTAPVQVNQVAGDARVSGENPPRVALVPRPGRPPEIVVVWTARAGSASTLRHARSVDGGHRFSAAAPVPGSDAAGMRGWHSLTVDAKGHVTVLWLDHRGLAASGASHSHGPTSGAAGVAPAPSTDPTARAGRSEVMVARLDGSSATSIARSPCYCCKTAIVSDGPRRYAAWRHVFPGGERDIAFAASLDEGRHFTAPIRLSEDRWKLDGCPDNGPALAVDPAHAVHAVWPTLDQAASGADLALYYAVARDGRRFSARARIPTGGPAAHVQVAVGRDGTPVIVWDEVNAGVRRLGVTKARTTATGVVSFERVALGEIGSGAWYPSLAASTTGVFATWVQPRPGGSTIGVARIP